MMAIAQYSQRRRGATTQTTARTEIPRAARKTWLRRLAGAVALGAAVWPGLATSVGAQSIDEQQPPIQARPGGPENTPRTDQEQPVTKGTRLVISNNAGEVIVRSWDRDAVRVQASHSTRERVDIQTAEQTLRIRARTERGPAGLVDFQLTVPRWMPVNLSGTYLEATIEGTSAEVTVETVNGNVRVVGGSGAVSVRSVAGRITVEKASGRVQATTVNEGIRLSGVAGDMTAETTNGDIVIENAQTSSLEVSTVNGDITFNGTVRDNGAYRLTTHSGDVRVGLGGAANATVFVRTFRGDFDSDFPIQLPEGQSNRSGSLRFNFTLGTGSARIEVQSFNGDIRLARTTVRTPDEERAERRGRTPKAPQPAQPRAPQPAPAPKAPKPPGLDDVEWDASAPALVDVDVRAVWGHVDAPDVDADVDIDADGEVNVEVDTPPLGAGSRTSGVLAHPAPKAKRK
jgi:DUF4097 and DUF4098 domain-containing protein YvlB